MYQSIKGGKLMGNENYRKQNSDGSILKWIGRFILVAIVLVIT